MKNKYIIIIIIISILYIILFKYSDLKYLYFNNSNYVYKNYTNYSFKESSNEEEYILYIYNSHQNEEYKSDNLSYSITPTVYHASFILEEYLNKYNIKSIVETRSINDYVYKNKLDYTGCYTASREYIKDTLNKYNSIKYIIDLHRDSVSREYTLYEKDKIKYARVMFVMSTMHENYQSNLNFANYINNKINENYNGLSRGIYKRSDGVFNQDLNENAILIELGGIDNTLEEINNTLEVLSKILSEYINGN